MSVGVQREACRKMPQHARYGFDVHTVLQGQCGKGMPEIVGAYVRQPGIFQNFLVQVYDRIGVIHLSCDG